MTQFIKDIPIEKKTQDKVRACLKSYRELFPDEYEIVIKQIEEKRWLLDDGEFATAKEEGVIRRGLFEIPEALDTIITKYLTTEELEQFKGLKGARWFAKAFPQFRIPEQI